MLQSLFNDSLRPPKCHGIYSIINRNNLKIYVGSGRRLNERFNRHVFDLVHGKHHSKHLQRAINRDPSAFEFSVIEMVPDPSSLIIREQFWIDFYKSSDYESGYNIAPKAGSSLGVKLDLTPEQRESISKRFRGKKLSPETCKKISDFLRTRKRNPLTAEQKLRMSIAHIGIRRKRSSIDKWLANRRQHKWGYRAVIQMDDLGTEIARFDSMQAADNGTGIDRANIHTVCRGRRPKAGGFKWKYAN